MRKRDKWKDDNQSAVSTKGGLVIAGILLAVGFVIIAACVDTIVEGRQSMLWPTVQGTILKAESGRSVHAHSPSYTILYAFELHGKRYESSRIGIGLGASSRCELANYQPGQIRTVYVNQTEPAQSVLLPGQLDNLTPYLIGGFLVVAAGLFVLFTAFYYKKREGRGALPLRAK